MSMDEEEVVGEVLVVSRDLGWSILTLILILCFPHHTDRSVIIWVGLSGILAIARAITSSIYLFYLDESSDHNTSRGLVNCFIIILALGLATAASILEDHIPQFPLWLVFVALAYYVVYSVLFACIGGHIYMFFRDYARESGTDLY